MLLWLLTDLIHRFHIRRKLLVHQYCIIVRGSQQGLLNQIAVHHLDMLSVNGYYISVL